MNDQDRQQIAADGGTEIFVKRQPHESISQTIIRGIAEVQSVAERDLSPLYNSVEPELLDELMKHSQRYQSDLSVEFTYEGCTVLIRDNTEIKITGVSCSCK